MRLLKIQRFRPQLRYMTKTWYGVIWPRFEWIYARKGGGAVLITDCNWRLISGIMITTSRSWWFIEFRRFDE